MALAGDFEVVRDPVWNNIQIDARSLRVVDSAPAQRLRYVRQLGHAYLVYPGATHSRFEHALGTYHLARRALGQLAEHGELGNLGGSDVATIPLAALLHDVGHYPFSHALEEAGLQSHEMLAARHIDHPELGAALAAFGIPHLADRLVALIRGTSTSPLQGLIAGSLDLDKIEYLTRDAWMCGVPYGTVDVDRLLHSITLVSLPNGGLRVGLNEKGVSALESLLFAKYQMYRNVYWHHAVRSATAMFKRLIRSALATGHLDPEWIADSTDETLMDAVRGLPDTGLSARLRRRQLYKRALDIRARELPSGGDDWMASDPDLVEVVENRLAEELGLRPGRVLLDYPAKPDMLAVDLPLRMRDGRTEQIGASHRADLLGIHAIAEELHMQARRLRVFVGESVRLDEAPILALIERTGAQVSAEVDAGRPLVRTG